MPSSSSWTSATGLTGATGATGSAAAPSPLSCVCLSTSHETYDPLAASLGECVFGARETASFYVGLLSVVCWLFCQGPQIIENYRRGSTEGLSAGLLAQWLAGDSINLVGVLLTHQLLFQRVAAFMFVTLDAIMVAQKAFYTLRARRRALGGEGDLGAYLSEDGAAGSDGPFDLARRQAPKPARAGAAGGAGARSSGLANPLLGAAAVAMVAAAALVVDVPGAAAAAAITTTTTTTTTLGADAGDAHLLGRARTPHPTVPSFLVVELRPSCEVEVEVSAQAKFFGNLCGWLATLMYLGSRLPQIYLIRSRRSVEGMSLTMFSVAVLANALYGSALLLKSTTSDAFFKALPWLVGSLGVLTLDCFIVSQFFLFRGAPPLPLDDAQDVSREVEGRRDEAQRGPGGRAGAAADEDSWVASDR